MGMGQIVDYSQFILQIEKAIANGVASLDSNAKVPKNQISLNASDVGAIATGGTAGTANQLTAPRTISTTGDATYSVSFDGSANVSSAITLANTGVAAGTYNALSTQVRPFTVDAKGRITEVGTPVNITPPWSAITGTPTTLAGYGITNALPLSGGTVTGVTTFSNATSSTSLTTGAVVVSGGLGVGGAIFAGSYNLIPIGRGGGGTPSNLSIGINALRVNSTGTNNVAIGINSLYSNTTGFNCQAIGDSSLFSNTSGAGNTAVGNSSLYSNTTASNNSAFGHASLLGKVGGDSCSALGSSSGRFTSDGVTVLTTSTNSCFFGANTKGTENAINENVFGYNATGNGSNTVTIGDNSITNNFFRGALSLNATQVISTRRTGWAAPTGTATRTTFATSTVTLSQLAERVKALIDDLTTHGLIGA